MNNKKIYTAFAVLLMMAGCGKNVGTPEIKPTPEPGASALLELNVGIGAIDTRSAAVVGTGFDRESKINVLLTDYGGGQLHYNNKSCVYVYKEPTGGGGIWLPDVSNPLQVNEDAMVLAHYPSTLPPGASYIVTTNTFTPVVAQTLDYGDIMAGEYNGDNSVWFSFKSGTPASEVFLADGEIDYMYGKMTNTGAVNSTNKMAQIQMWHGLTMVVFNIYKSEQNIAPCVVTSISVKNKGAATALKNGSYNILSGEFTTGATTQYVRTMDNFPDDSYFGMMLFPATIAANEVVAEFIIDNQTYTLPIGACSWKAGSVNLYKVRITPVKAELVDAVKIVDWGTGTDKGFEIN